ncbi:tetratricopeptide repeat protein [Candidatus Purcelliella pentastirinorum]|uniref:Tetratricopeptide repeat protein n=1 Tax=Candidatus Purcelliella pentastirinorum TaxID=472834 RepID=A0AAX3NAA8_9ENTR|nr:tetratricopeptide repeat protein [Candidatus Purcelliella pentastirinorum]WDI78395.1 tetratricopeptide repeat protein [Candidatus Purcelliella pentastirinorum]
MKFAFDFDFSKISICEAVIKILCVIRTDCFINDTFDKLNILESEANIYFSNYIVNNEYDKLKILLKLFYKKWNFRSADGIYILSEVLLIDKVIFSRKGTAISLGILLLHIAQKFSISLNPVIFPTQLILRFDFSDGKILYINPFNGDILSRHVLELWLKGNVSFFATLHDNYLSKADSFNVIRKIFNILKGALMEEKKMEEALNISNLLLKLSPEDPYEIRDRGLIYAHLDCGNAALNDLIYFVEHCPEDPISEIIKIQIHSIERKHVIFH